MSAIEDLRFSVGQMCKFVVYCAVVCACIVPAIQIWVLEPSLGHAVRLVGLEVAVMPVILAGLSFVMVQKGRWKDQLIRILLLVPTSIVFGGSLVYLVLIAVAFAPGSPFGAPPTAKDVASVAIGNLIFAPLFAFLLSRVLRGRPSRKGVAKVESFSSENHVEPDLVRGR